MRVTTEDIKQMKRRGERIPTLTAYDYATAKIVDAAGVPLILVGDSLGMVMLGYESTIPVTVEEMLHHIKAVVRGAKRALVVGDLPFMSYHLDISQALKNAGRFIQEGGCQAVKLEGGVRMAETVRRLVENGIPVQGHIGLTPQSVHQFGGYKVQGKTPEAAAQLVRDAVALDQAGAFSIVLETVPAPLAKLITEKVSVPIIGIGAGPYCDGQIQVISDILGLFTDFVPRHAKLYANLSQVIGSAVSQYMSEVKDKAFPTAKESYTMSEEAIAELAKIG